MSRALLDVNVLLALLDSDHAHHALAQAWLQDHIDDGWASCAITENGFVRIVSQPRYPNAVSPSIGMGLLRNACDMEFHEFWPCDVSMLHSTIVDSSRIHGTRQVTDAYLLALAVHHDGAFVTFDRAISIATVRGADDHHLVTI